MEGPNRYWTSNYPPSDYLQGWSAGENYVSPSKWHERNREPGMTPGYFNHYQSDFSNRLKHKMNFAGLGPKGYQRSDERIREDVCEALTRSPYVDASDIEVEVNDGIVTLKGTVEDRRMKRLAEDCVEQATSVRDIHNQITVDFAPIANHTDDSVSQSMN